MPDPNPIASAARRVAEEIRSSGYGNFIDPGDLATLLPILDAVAGGHTDAGRVATLIDAHAKAHRDIAKAEYVVRPDRLEELISLREEARAQLDAAIAIALADAEAVVSEGDGR